MKSNSIHCASIVVYGALLHLAFILYCACGMNSNGKSDDVISHQESLIYILIDKYKNYFVERYYPLEGDSLYFNVAIRVENNDTLLTILGASHEEYYSMYDLPDDPRSNEIIVKSDSVFLIKRGNESVIVYMAEPNQRPLVNLLTGSAKLTDVKSVVLSFDSQCFYDMDPCTYVYH